MSNRTHLTRTLILLLVTVLLASGCGGPSLTEQDLVSTEWEVSEMEGFPEGNSAVGTFNFTDTSFRYNDGVNSASATIEWTDTGFVVEGGGSSTAVAADGAPLGQLNLLVAPGSEVEAELDGDTLTLTNDSMTVIATSPNE